MTDLSIVIVSWNVREYLERCLRLLEQGIGSLKAEVFVVDNASTDGSVAAIGKFQIPNLPAQAGLKSQIISNKKNLGFAKANNQAIRQAQGRYVLLLNPDTECTPKSLETLVRWMDAHPRCGILGPKLLNTDRSLQRSVRRFPNLRSSFSLFLLRQHTDAVKRYLADDFDYTREQQVEQVMGACFLIRREVLGQIGLLDERFFVWFEEVDFCLRAKNAGWEIWYTPSVSVIHHGGESFAQMRIGLRQWQFVKSLSQYLWKHRRRKNA